jgi:hypothetical protein
MDCMGIGIVLTEGISYIGGLVYRYFHWQAIIRQAVNAGDISLHTNQKVRLSLAEIDWQRRLFAYQWRVLNFSYTLSETDRLIWLVSFRHQ